MPCLLGQDLLELGKAGQTVHLLHLGLALDEGQGIVDEGLLDAVALGVDPLRPRRSPRRPCRT